MYAALTATNVAALGPSVFYPGSIALDLWLDPTDRSTLWQDAGATVPVTTSGDPVRLIQDKSGNGNHFTAPSDAARPIFRTGGGVCWLEFDGVDDQLNSGAVSGYVTATDYDVLIAGRIYKNASIVQAFFVFEGGFGRFFVQDPNDLGHIIGSNFDGGFDNVDYTGLFGNVRHVYHQRHTGGNLSVTIDDGTTNTTTSGNTTDISVNGILCNGGSSPVRGRLYGMIASKTVFGAGDLANLKTYLNNRFVNAGPSISLIFTMGESNAGGAAINASATAHELAPRSSLKIFNNYTYIFEDVDVGTNNLLDHGGFPDNATHGIEIGLANIEEDDDRWPNQLYLLKAGQGGSVIASWVHSQISIGNWLAFTTRMAAAIEELDKAGLSPVYYGFISLGINDAAGFTSEVSVRNCWIGMADDVRTVLNNSTIKVGFTELPAGNAERDLYNAEFTNVLAADPNNFEIDTTGCELNTDGIHWSYAGFKEIADRYTTLMGY